jgi:hypothetical protein
LLNIYFWLPFAHVADGSVTLSPIVNYTSHEYFSRFNTIDAAGSGQDNAELQQSSFTKKSNQRMDWVLFWTGHRRRLSRLGPYGAFERTAPAERRF